MNALLPALLLLSAIICHAGETYKTLKEFKAAVYQQQQKTGGCYKLLNISGAVGCQTPTQHAVEGILMNAADVQWPLTAGQIIVCQLSEFEPLMHRLLAANDSSSHVLGVLVDPRGTVASQSSADPFPNAFAAPYSNKDYVWNPAGTGLARQFFNFPVVRLSPTLASEAVGMASYNSAKSFEGTLYWSTIQLSMNALGTSMGCLQEGFCSPLGSFSVWSSLPHMAPYPLHSYPAPIPGSGQAHGPLPPPDSPLPITLVIAQQDTGGMFHDYVQAANSPLSGLVAMLTAMDMLKTGADASTYTRRIIFLAIAGEPWDYMGSRRLLWEMDPMGAAALNVSYLGLGVQGFDMELVDQVIEIGMVGRAYNSTSNSTTLYLHTQQPGSGYGDTSALSNVLQQAAAQTTEMQVTVTPASASNPGVPPSSLMSFLRYKPQIQGIVLTEFDQQYINPYYHSILDNASYVDLEALSSTAMLLARSLHTLASGGASAAPLQVDASRVASVASNLAQCVMLDIPGLLCPLAGSFMESSFSDANAEKETRSDLTHYVQPMTPSTYDPASTQYKRDMQRFLFNFMANATAAARSNMPCDPITTICPNGMVCYAWFSGTDPSKSASTMGVCISSTTMFVQSLSTRVFLNEDGYFVTVPESEEFNAAYSWPVDPLWTESYWPNSIPSVSIFMRESYATQVSILIAGILLTLLTGIASYGARLAFDKHLKSQ